MAIWMQPPDENKNVSSNILFIHLISCTQAVFLGSTTDEAKIHGGALTVAIFF